ncbi:polysaccharide pyruvyl transferase family protein [Gordonia amicalis]|nr:polysaccharide pyruvyl transferase family protein [Gordonia amicalis]UKO94023.1 polysaccharide pyruvyl transferase family protein [Gordonia amicalis]
MPISCEIESRKLRFVARLLGRRVKWRVRDSASLSSLRRCGIPSELVPDLAFANHRESSQPRDLTVVALVGSDYLGGEAVARLVRGVALAVKERDLPTPISIVTMHTSLSGTSVGGDLDVANLLKNQLSECDVPDVQISSLTSFDDVCVLCERASVVISARMHAGIAALCAGARVGMLAYEEKHFSLMRDLDLGEYVIPITSESSEISALAGRLVNADFRRFRESASRYRTQLIDAEIASV